MTTDIQSLEVLNHGQIKRLVLPPGWVEEQVERGEFQLWSLRQFHPLESHSVTLSLYYRGHPVSAASGESFESLLEKGAHELDDSECWSVQEVLRDAAVPEAFVPLKVQTRDWRGRRILLAEGKWPRTEEESLGIFINAADHGCQVQEIHYRAPAGQYLSYIDTVMKALHSIEWTAVEG